MTISGEKQIELRNRAKNELERIERILKNEENKMLIENFKNTFLMCESTYKIILAEHQKYKGKGKSRLIISMSQAPYALEFAGYDFEKDLLTKLFGAETRAGMKSVKKIRDSLTHKLDNNTVEELSTRKEELFGYMNEFLEKIRKFDQKKIA